ncbi:MAG: DUF2141 domain-containing protein [Bacteroidota bacterium]
MNNSVRLKKMFNRLLIIYNQRSWLITALILILFFVVMSGSVEAQQENLVVEVSGFIHDRGQAVVNLYREKDDIPKKPFLRDAVEIRQGKATSIFSNLQYGDYAIIVFHDENSNNDLDHNFFGFPKEPLGYSNGFKFSLFSGMPNFSKLRFSFGVDAKPLKITVD